MGLPTCVFGAYLARVLEVDENRDRYGLLTKHGVSSMPAFASSLFSLVKAQDVFKLAL